LKIQEEKMKRLLVSLFAVCLLFALSMPAAAVDVKFSGVFAVEGISDNNATVTSDDVNRAWYAQRLVLDTTFQVAEGLSLTTRARILDKIWGDTADQDRLSSVSRYERENVEFERAYLTAKLGPGVLVIGKQPAAWGTEFNNTDAPVNRIKYTYMGLKGWALGVALDKLTEKELTLPAGVSTPSAKSDIDSDRLNLTAVYTAPTWDAGLRYFIVRDKTNDLSVATSYNALWHTLTPYFKGNFGPLYVEAEGQYKFGTLKNYDHNIAGSQEDQTVDAYYLNVKARYAIKNAYVGAQYAYLSGDDATTGNRNEGGLTSGRDWKPCLILLDSDRDKYAGKLGSGPLANNYSNGSSGGSDNFVLYQVFAGIKPIPALDIMASYAYVKMVEQGSFLSDKIGSEADITASYKIYDNLSYMVGFGYLWAGDAFKGTAAQDLDTGNDWLLMHRLTLTF
jgi:hypothetical protein